MSERHRLQRAQQPRSTERGSMFLLWTLTFSATIMVLVVGYFPMFQTSVGTGARTFHLEQAISLADAAAQRAVWEAETRDGADLQLTTPEGWLDLGAATCGALDGTADTVLYGVPVTSCHAQNNNPTPVPADDNFGGQIGSVESWIVNWGNQQIIAVGRTTLSRPDGTDLIETSVSPKLVLVTLQRPSLGDPGAFGRLALKLDGSAPVHVDSYDATMAAYNPASPGTQGHLGTNGETTVGGEADFFVEQSDSTVQGQMQFPAGSTTSVPGAWAPTGGYATVAPVTLPRIQIPTDLTALPVTTGSLGPGTSTNGSGHYHISGSWTCNAPIRVRSLFVTGAVTIADGCELFIDPEGEVPPYSLTGVAMDTDGSGQLVKNGTGTTPVFIRDGHINSDGPGWGYTAAVPEANRLPEQLQIYLACSAAPTSCSYNATFAQTLPFYGVIYAEGGSVVLNRGSDNGVSYTNDYHGIFAAEEYLRIWGELRDQGAGLQDYMARVHIDRSLRDFWLDGSGTQGYRVTPGTWRVAQ